MSVTKIYFDNAHRLFASLPLPVVRAKRIHRDFRPDGELDERMAGGHADTAGISIEQCGGETAVEYTGETESDEFLYLSYECPQGTQYLVSAFGC